MLTYERLLELLDYDEETGLFYWRQRNGRAQEGELAGHNLPGGTATLIGIDGEKYRTSRLAWLYATGSWPIGQVRALNGDLTDTRFENLRDTMDPDDDSPAAERARARRAERHALAERRASMHRIGRSLVDGVRQSPNGDWVVTQPDRPSLERGRFATPEEAEEFQNDFESIIAAIRSNPVPYPRPPDLENRAGGPWAMTLAQARAYYFYHPTRGHLYYREGDRKGIKADRVDKQGRLIVSFGPRHYPAAQLAWFIMHGVWLRPKSLVFKNANPHDIRAANMILRSEIKGAFIRRRPNTRRQIFKETK